MDTSPKQGEQAFALHQIIVKNEQDRRVLLARNIAALKQIKENNLYKAVLGDETADWKAYLAQIETFYTRSEVHNMFRVFDKFVTELGFEYESISDIPISRLLLLIPIIDKDNSEELLSSARVLTRRDFNNIVRGKKGLPTTDTCNHDYEHYLICKICGDRRKHEIKE